MPIDSEGLSRARKFVALSAIALLVSMGLCGLNYAVAQHGTGNEGLLIISGIFEVGGMLGGEISLIVALANLALEAIKYREGKQEH